MSDTLLLDTHDDGVAVLTFNRPHVRNALDLETMRRFVEMTPQLAYEEYEDALQVERTTFPPLWAADAHFKAVQNFLQKG